MEGKTERQSETGRKLLKVRGGRWGGWSKPCGASEMLLTLAPQKHTDRHGLIIFDGQMIGIDEY